jgi:hypothetical protein
MRDSTIIIAVQYRPMLASMSICSYAQILKFTDVNHSLKTEKYAVKLL